MSSARGLHRFYNVNGWLFVAPAVGLISLFMVYPILSSLWMSFQTGRGMMQHFGGFANIERLFIDPMFRLAFSNTMMFLVVQLPIMLSLAMLLAVVLNNPKLRFRGLFRTAIFLPCVSSLVGYSVIFKSLFVADGLVNRALEGCGLIAEPIPWTTDPFWARALIIIAITWRWTGYNMIFYLSALQNIDKSIYEAARIDGVSAPGRLFFLTVPMLKPVILFTTVTSTIGTLQLFDEIRNILPSNAGGAAGPSNSALTLSVYIYNLTFKFMPNLGYAATVSWVIVLAVALLSAVQFLVLREGKR